MFEKGKFNEERVNTAFRKVRNRLRKHFPFEIVLACVKKLNEHPTDSLEHLRMYPPWRLLLLTKWALIHGEYIAPNRRPLTVARFNYLLNLMYDFEGSLRHPGEYENVFLFFRNMAFQQFWLQHPFNIGDFARQSLLFGRLDSYHPFQKRFAEKYGISISEFIELATMIMGRFTILKQKSVTPGWFRNVAPKYKPGTIQRFLDILAIDFESLKKKLVKQQSNRKVQYEAYEKTPLRETPLLRHDSMYYPFCPELLARCLETFIYDTLRSDGPNDFMNRFGPIFEKYVGNSIANTNIGYFDEKELSATLTGQGKLVDYLLVHEGNKIFIDAKGVEISYLGMVGHQPEVIADKTRTSIVKGIHQGFETASRLGSIKKLGEIESGNENNYLIVVTFKDMFVGNGLDFYENVAKGTLSELVGQYGGRPPIPFEHMYFVSIDDFDLLTGGIASGDIALTEILLHAVKSDALGETKKFTFGQHIYDMYPKQKPPPWLLHESKYIVDRCKVRFGEED